MRRVLACAILLVLLAAPSAWARDPITPLRDVHRGLRCTALTVVQGTTISSFDVDVLDVVAGIGDTDAWILVHVSGPAVDRSGIASGFSGSPVYCPDANGTIGNAGAISATIGQYGNDVGLVTPIEQMLDIPVKPPSGVRRAPKLLRAARPVSSPLVLSGLSPAFGAALERSALAQGHVLVAAPAGPLGTFPPQPLVPGASVGVALSSGALAAGAIGTVTFRDGDVVYGFGHPLEAAGRRALLLQDAYVFTVVSNPLGIGQISSFKLAAPGHTVGTLSSDGLSGVVGTVGAAPRTVPLTVRVRDRETGRSVTQRTNLVDEVDLGDPDGQGLLSGLAAAAVAQAVTTVFDGAPSHETGRFCLTVRLRELRRPLRFCNRHVVKGTLDAQSPAPIAVTMSDEVSSALDVIANARFRALHLTSIDVSATVERGLRLATIQSARLARHAVRPGERVGVTLKVRLYRGPLRTVHFALAIPRDVRPGRRTLRLLGTPLQDADSGGLLSSIISDLFGDGGSRGAQSMFDVIVGFEGLAQNDGVTALIGHHRERAYRSSQVRIDGRAMVDVKVLKPARPHGHSPAIGRVLRHRQQISG
ncbi:MAG TPA: hypothetical protein VKB25_10580 [Conexibacter sp.]|nr:hypothetical protein [Conexibacter sp.]